MAIFRNYQWDHNFFVAPLSLYCTLSGWGLNVAATLGIQTIYRFMRYVMIEVDELVLCVDHHPILTACWDFFVHLRRLLCFLSVLLRAWPNCSTHLLDHVDWRHGHHGVQHDIDRDRNKIHVKVTACLVNPFIKSIREFGLTYLKILIVIATCKRAKRRSKTK